MTMIPHLLSCAQFRSVEDLITWFDFSERLASSREVVASGACRGKILATLFFEPSLRTRWSFEAAMLRLGGSVLSEGNAVVSSSSAKGETLEDMVRTISASYADAIVLRHPSDGAAQRAAAVSSIPVINGGDGCNEHPTQAMLDMHAIHRELGRLRDFRIVIVGDLSSSRVVKSLTLMLRLCPGVRLSLVSPESLRLPSVLVEPLRASGIEVDETVSLAEALSRPCDIVYLTRLQVERGGSSVAVLPEAWAEVKFTPEMLAALPEQSIVMHPGPASGEIEPAMLGDRRVAYVRQTVFGTAMRMAILARLLSRPDLLS